MSVTALRTETPVRVLCSHAVMDSWGAELVCSAFADWTAQTAPVEGTPAVLVHRCTNHARPLADAGWVVEPLPAGPPPGRHRA